MHWINGPFQDQTILWLGLRAFWWKRILGSFQLLSGVLILANLVTEQRKARIAAWLEIRRRKSTQVKVPPLIRLRTVFGWTISVISILAFIVADAQILRAGNGLPLPFFSAFLIAGFLLAIFSIPIVQAVILFSTAHVALKVGQRYVPPVFAWLFNHRRFDKTINILNFLLFIAICAGQIYLT